MMNNTVTTIYLVNLFAAVLGIMGVVCLVERPTLILKTILRGRR